MPNTIQIRVTNADNVALKVVVTDNTPNDPPSYEYDLLNNGAYANVSVEDSGNGTGNIDWRATAAGRPPGSGIGIVVDAMNNNVMVRAG
jgi:hypothetical protein